ncbi:glycine cleavage system aminomethyltransferase GcvT [Rhodobacterales bacterium HKCCE3408]|nr:glycine cleavage system aminomethyltransferase GcvT [Rhodobacterales bacterium HKCCE3408]
MGETLLPLADLHAELGAKFVPFAGWSMPVQYTAGVMAEHLWCREKAGLFDVSHMGQVMLPADADATLEGLVPVDVIGLPQGRQRYGLFTNEAGGILDDLMIARRADGLYLVVNAACAEADIAHLKAHLSGVEPLTDRALLALQGPMAGEVLATILPGTETMRFMDHAVMIWEGADLWVSRSGYTGEDGFEISIPVAIVEPFARALLADERVAPIGLGARDSLRLEAGLPLYGQDLSPEITPVEAGLTWAIQKVRRRGGAREGGFPGADKILHQIEDGAPRKRIGLMPEGRAPMRGGTALYATETGGLTVGEVTSGGFGPSLGAPMAIALVDADLPDDAMIWGEVRGKRLPARQAATPFVAPGYKR